MAGSALLAPSLRTGYPARVNPLESVSRLLRSDSWTNLITGFGTSRDKGAGSYFAAGLDLTDPELADLFTHDDIAGKIVDASPREEFREPFGLKGFNPDSEGAVMQYLDRFQLAQHCTGVRIWGRCFGNAATWIQVDDGLDTIEPLDLTRINTVTGLETLDKRYLQPHRYYTDGPRAGACSVYLVQSLSENGQVTKQIGYIHESRLVMWPGARTERQSKIRRGGWDYSVLQKPYNALKSAGNTWKAIEALTVDANQAVYKIKDLWRMIATDPAQGKDYETKTGPSGGLLRRIQFMDLARSAMRAIVLDSEGEEFERTSSTFTGLPDLSDKAWLRVACAADMPVTILTGQSPAGLQATGASDLRWWYGKVQSEQLQTCEPRIKQILRVLFAAKDAPKLSDQEQAALAIVWFPLWAPTALELAEMKSKAVAASQILIQEQAITPEEAILSMPAEWFPAVDRKQREQTLLALQEAGPEEQKTATLQLTPTDIAAVVTVNQALASVGLPPIADPEGSSTVEAYRAKAQADAQPKPIPGTFGRTDGGRLDEKQGAMVRWIHRHDAIDYEIAWGRAA